MRAKNSPKRLKMQNYISPCPVETTLNIIGNKWKFLIIWHLLSGKKRFGELQRSISATKNQDISQKVLTQNLRELQEAGLVAREVFAQVPPKVEYSLTPLGASLSGLFTALLQWGEGYILAQSSPQDC